MRLMLFPHGIQHPPFSHSNQVLFLEIWVCHSTINFRWTFGVGKWLEQSNKFCIRTKDVATAFNLFHSSVILNDHKMSPFSSLNKKQNTDFFSKPSAFSQSSIAIWDAYGGQTSSKIFKADKITRKVESWLLYLSRRKKRWINDNVLKNINEQLKLQNKFGPRNQLKVFNPIKEETAQTELLHIQRSCQKIFHSRNWNIRFELY